MQIYRFLRSSVCLQQHPWMQVKPMDRQLKVPTPWLLRIYLWSLFRCLMVLDASSWHFFFAGSNWSWPRKSFAICPCKHLPVPKQVDPLRENKLWPQLWTLRSSSCKPIYARKLQKLEQLSRRMFHPPVHRWTRANSCIEVADTHARWELWKQRFKLW